MSRIIDRRDQQFVLFEMLGVQDLFATGKYREFSRETFDMMLEMAQKISEEEARSTWDLFDEILEHA